MYICMFACMYVLLFNFFLQPPYIPSFPSFPCIHTQLYNSIFYNLITIIVCLPVAFACLLFSLQERNTYFIQLLYGNPIRLKFKKMLSHWIKKSVDTKHR